MVFQNVVRFFFFIIKQRINFPIDFRIIPSLFRNFWKSTDVWTVIRLVRYWTTDDVPSPLNTVHSPANLVVKISIFLLYPHRIRRTAYLNERQRVKSALSTPYVIAIAISTRGSFSWKALIYDIESVPRFKKMRYTADKSVFEVWRG